MYIIITISILLMCIYFMYIYIHNKYVSNKHLFVLVFCIFCIFFVCEVSYIVREEDDLYRCFQLMSTYRSFINKLDFQNIIYFMFYNNVPIWDFFLFILSFFEKNIMVYISTIIILSNLYYIISHLNTKYKLKTKYVPLIFVVFFGLLTPYHLMYTIRNALAVSIMALGIFKIEFENNRKQSFVFIIISMLIHNSVLIILLFYLLANAIFKWKWYKTNKIILILLVLLPWILKIIIIVNSQFQISLLNRIINILPYAFKVGLIYDYRTLIGIEVFVLLNLYAMHKLIRKEISVLDVFSLYILCFILGCAPYLLFVERYSFLLPYLFIFSLSKYAKYETVRSKLLIAGCYVICVLLLLLNIYLIYNYFNFSLFHNLFALYDLIII